MIIFVVEMLRNDDRENHSYLDGVYDDELLALKNAWEHMKARGGKYGAEITGYTLNDNERVYFRKLSHWDAFAASCKDTAEKLKVMLEEHQPEHEGE